MASQLAPSIKDHAREVSYLTCALTDATNHTVPITATGATDFCDVRAMRQVAIQATNGITTAAIFTVEVSLDGIVWDTAAYRTSAAASYVLTAKTTAVSDTDQLFLPPDDLVAFVRVNVSTANANGTTFTVHGRS